MKFYGYIKARTEKEQEEKKREIKNYINYKINDIEYITSLKNLKENSTLYIDSLCSFGSTTYQILNIFFKLHFKNINIHTYKDKYSDSKLNFLTYNVLIDLLNHEKKNIDNRLYKTTITLHKKMKRAGKKKGKKTKSIFDKHKKIIFSELSKNTTKVQILNMLKEKDPELKDITSQALGQYIKKVKIKTKKSEDQSSFKILM
ncbi:hypothetical protein LXN10_01105 [Arcobacter sp. KX21116]|uniref:hypothetical protein n=1 Tax=Arcobacter iocasae TaxID=2906515 RepID=UPI0035D48FA1